METIFFTGNPLDRSFESDRKREEDGFMLKCLKSSNAQFIITMEATPATILCETFVSDAPPRLRLLSLDDVKGVIGGEDSRILVDFVCVLLGCLHHDENVEWYFALSLPQSFESAFLYSPGGNSQYMFMSGRSVLFKFQNREEISIAGQALAVCCWHSNNVYHGSTGEETVPVECGLKRQSRSAGRKLYPRTDPVMIACVVSPDGKSCLLGHMKRSPPNFFSCLAGFIEPCESIEEAVRREVWEESGVRVGDVQLINSQPWPIGRGGGCELMIGCVAYATTWDIVLQDQDVSEVRWFDMEAMAQMVEDASTRTDLRGARDMPYIPGPYALAFDLCKRFVSSSLPQRPVAGWLSGDASSSKMSVAGEAMTEASLQEPLIVKGFKRLVGVSIVGGIVYGAISWWKEQQ